ncbi:EamA family transporter [Ameyamaea chiangmaiensis]|uniref:EamA family transporter n=1 Tax=Ameyamaea chiangmaiensis TaxID=442969 RepID=A0A850PFS8_9PROT|nr:EamA family transporter [Ameyamaea chiangmaiensis]MBS4074096.1 EamA family transporter [Ameyamaea chiangmaiensis]NVN41300.1 EamA family transporter [Ameyamaea chiangmaiensis]
MSPVVFAVVLFAASLHATWNAIVKRGSDTLLTTVLVATAAAVLGLLCVPFLPPPARASWPYLATSSLLQVVYFALVARAYHLADMSQTYPLMRGTAPLLVATATTLGLGRDALSTEAWAGVATICAGILCMTGGQRRKDGHAGTTIALINAVVIAGYTLVDGTGVRLSGAPAAYTLWLSILTGVPLLGWAVIVRRDALVAYASRNGAAALTGGAGTLASYGLALWAMTRAPVAVIAALRETSIVFGVAISALVLHEPVRRRRVAAAVLICAGAIILRLGAG